MGTCTCVRHSDGSVTTMLCSVHAQNDPCLTMASVTGRRRKGSIVRGVCSSCGWTAPPICTCADDDPCFCFDGLPEPGPRYKIRPSAEYLIGVAFGGTRIE